MSDIRIPFQPAWEHLKNKMPKITVEGGGGEIYTFSETAPEDTSVIWVDITDPTKLIAKVHSDGTGWKALTPDLAASTGNDFLGISIAIVDFQARIGLDLQGLANLPNDMPMNFTSLPVYDGSLNSNRKIDFYNSKAWGKIETITDFFNTNFVLNLKQGIGLIVINTNNDLNIDLGSPSRAEVYNGSIASKIFDFIIYRTSSSATGRPIFKNGATTLFTGSNIDGTTFKVFPISSGWRVIENQNPLIQGNESTAASGASILGSITNKVQNFKKIVAGANINIVENADNIEVSSTGGGGSAPIVVTNADFGGDLPAVGGSFYEIDTDSDYLFIIGGAASSGSTPNQLNICIASGLTLSVGRRITIIKAANTTSSTFAVVFRCLTGALGAVPYKVNNGASTFDNSSTCPTAFNMAQADFILTNYLDGTDQTFQGVWIQNKLSLT